MLQIDAAHGAVLLAPAVWSIRGAKLGFEQFPALGAEAIHHRFGAGALVVLELGEGAFEASVVEEQLKAAQERLDTAAKQGGQV